MARLPHGPDEVHLQSVAKGELDSADGALSRVARAIAGLEGEQTATQTEARLGLEPD